ncbi:uncharacterized protein LOC126902516 [Daktulosphaira vitifoliae]|uniref:uncharacterized protein LOC126902516 n=1 Tax=Daktulosphaira vitifoliae TaxID=58002 RepID=UPI0021AAF34C|nr:uncharacterized protein LOC126902516 [Daktulosphaira vitifoliae]
MIFITILSILLFNSKTVKSVDNERHCNFSRYMLNYFKLNEHYLLQMYSNSEMYTEEDLKKYGQAIQTHGDVVLLMIQELHKINENNVIFDLMSVNLYLNNNSGSVNLMYKYQTANNVDNNKVFLGIQGLKLQNNSMITIIERFIEMHCLNKPISAFVEYPNEYISHQLNIDALDIDIKDLREKIIKEINPEIVEENNLTRFHPRNMLFYDIMLNQSDKNVTTGTESRQHQEFVNFQQKNILDLLRFVPLNLQCADKSDLTINDVFRYVNYQYMYVDVRAFQTLMLAAAFHPVGMLIANYIQFVSAIIQVGPNPINYQKTDKLRVHHLGKRIKNLLQQFIDLNIFIGIAYNFLVSIMNKFYVILSWVQGIPLKVVNLPNIILTKLKEFMDRNLLKFNVESETIAIDQNVIHIHDKILIVELYHQELIKHTNLFKLIYTTKNLERICVKNYKWFLLPILIDYLCTDNPIDYCNSDNDKCIINDSSSEINIYDLGNNDGLEEFKTENIEHFKKDVFKNKKNKSMNPLIDMKDVPRHMMDYFICRK